MDSTSAASAYKCMNPSAASIPATDVPDPNLHHIQTGAISDVPLALLQNQSNASAGSNSTSFVGGALAAAVNDASYEPLRNYNSCFRMLEIVFGLVLVQHHR